MVFKHLVKYNGVYYPAGADVPVGDKPVDNKKKSGEVVEEKAPEAPKEDELAVLKEIRDMLKKDENK